MKKIILTFILLIVVIFIQAQKKGQARIDSLLNVLSTSKEDTNKVNILNDLSFSCYSKNPDKGIDYGNQALTLAEKLKWSKGIGKAFNSIGVNYGWGKLKFSEAFDFFNKAVNIYNNSGLKLEEAFQYQTIANLYINQNDLKKMKIAYEHAIKIYETLKNKFTVSKILHRIAETYYSHSEYNTALNYYLKETKMLDYSKDKNQLGAANLGIGNCYYFLSDFPKTLEFYLNSLKIFEESNRKEDLARCLGNIGNVYNAIKDYNKALDFYFKSVKIFQELDKPKSVALNTSNVGLAYFNMRDYPNALEYYLKALQISEKNNFEFEQELVLGNIGELYRMQSDFNKALEYNFKALHIAKKIDDHIGIAFNYGDIGHSYLEKATDSNQLNITSTLSLKLAINYLDSSIMIYKEVDDLDGLLQDYERLSRAQYLLGDYKDAIGNYKKYSLLKDSVFNIEKDKKITQQAMQFEFDKNETELLYNQRLTSEQLQKQMLLSKQQQQELDIKQQAIEITNKEKDLEKLNHQKTQAELNEQKLSNEKKEVELTLERKEVVNKKKERNYSIAGTVLFIMLFFFILRNYLNQKKSNLIISKEKDRSERLLLNILPYEVAEELKVKGSSDAKDYEKVTVLFTDFKGFTQISEKMAPSQLVGEINYCFSAFDNIIDKYGIEKIKTIGDSYMCAGGIPIENNTHPEDVVNAALEIRDFMNKQFSEKNLKGEIPFEIRIGIHTGPVVAGIVGVKKFAYDIWGDTVNTASRMESSGEPGKVNISGATYEHIKEKFNCIYRGKVEAKHKGMVDMYYVERYN